jgi:hypothetical protein
MEIKMAAPKKSLRPKARPKNAEGSTRHPSGKNMDERTKGEGSGTRHPSGKNIYEQDTKPGGKVKKMAGGGMCRGMGAATRGGNFVKG